MVEQAASRSYFAHSIEVFSNSFKARGLAFFASLWAIYFALGYCMLVQFSPIRDTLGLVTPLVFFAAVGILAWKALTVAIKFRIVSPPRSAPYFLTLIAMVYLAIPSLLYFKDCRPCSIPFATLRIIFSNSCNGFAGRGQASCELYSKEYLDLVDTIIVFDRKKTDAENVLKVLSVEEEGNPNFYVLFGRYILQYRPVVNDTGPIVSPYF